MTATDDGKQPFTQGQRAYQFRKETGEPWVAVAKKVGVCSPAAAVATAKKYALREGLTWPIQTDPDAQAAEALVVRDAEVYEKVKAGAIVSHIEGSASFVYSAIDRHCERTGAAPLPRKPERAYRMRVDHHTSWETIARDLGYARGNSANAAARQFAEANALPWPPDTGMTRRGWAADRYIGKPFYEAASEGTVWEDIATQCGRPKSYVLQRAAVYAEAHEQPWPI